VALVKMIFVDAYVEWPSGLTLQNAKNASVQRLEDVARTHGNVMYLNIKILGETFQ
jgi:hypothetical protein